MEGQAGLCAAIRGSGASRGCVLSSDDDGPDGWLLLSEGSLLVQRRVRALTWCKFLPRKVYWLFRFHLTLRVFWTNLDQVAFAASGKLTDRTPVRVEEAPGRGTSHIAGQVNNAPFPPVRRPA